MIFRQVLAIGSTAILMLSLSLLPLEARESFALFGGQGQEEGQWTAHESLESGFVVAQVDCRRAAEEAAAKTGGKVLSVQSRNGAGGPVCVVTVLVPGKNGERPRKRVLTIQP